MAAVIAVCDGGVNIGGVVSEEIVMTVHEACLESLGGVIGGYWARGAEVGED